MQKNDQEESVGKKTISHDNLKKIITRSSAWSIFLLFWSIIFLILIFLFFLSDDFRDKYSDWFFGSISKVTGRSLMPSDIRIHGSVDATVSRPFKDAAQACWYYHANYQNSHAYTILWKKSKVKDGYPKIRIIAEPAYWQAERCTEESGEVKLTGIEYTEHSIEAQFGKDKDFVQIATSKAYYRSALFFDEYGRITERRVLKSNFKYKSTNKELCKIIEMAERENGVKVKCEDAEGRERMRFLELKEEIDNFNILMIDSDFNPSKNWINPNQYQQAIIFYVEEREKLHTELVKEGCGAISVEPKLTEDSGNIFQTSIAFLCLKKSGKHSHMRLMHRVSEQKF